MQPFAPSPTRTACLALALFFSSALPWTAPSLQAMTIEEDVDPLEAPATLPTITLDEVNQTASVEGRTESLKALVTELCRVGGIELRAYGAADRPVRSRYRDMELRELFERLLWQENFLMGNAQREDGKGRRLAWLQVLGSDGAAGAQGGGAGGAAAGGGGAVRELVLPRTGYTTRSATIRRRTAEAFGRRLDEDAEARRRFLATPDAKYIDILKKETYSIAFMNELVGMVKDRPAKLKLERMVRSLQRAKDD